MVYGGGKRALPSSKGLTYRSGPSHFSLLVADETAACAQCSLANFLFTSLAGLAIGLQPLFTMALLYHSHHPSVFYRLWKKARQKESAPEGNIMTKFSAEMGKVREGVEKHLLDEPAQKKLREKGSQLFTIPYCFAIGFTVGFY